MKWLLISLLIIAVAIFTGTWIFDCAAWLFGILAKAFKFLSQVFNLFGWNNGLMLVKPLAISSLAVIGV